jgi:uncharacterized protein YaeQ
MALKPTIYKFEINLSDMDRHVYDTLNLTVAQHPSESVERMMARVLAYCLNACPELEFTRGVSPTDEPDLWAHSLSGELLLWIDVGEPSADRLKKASRSGANAKVYSINTKSDVWWRQVKHDDLSISFYRLKWPELVALAKVTSRTMSLSISISDNSLFVSADETGLTVDVETLKEFEA